MKKSKFRQSLLGRIGKFERAVRDHEATMTSENDEDSIFNAFVDETKNDLVNFILKEFELNGG